MVHGTIDVTMCYGTGRKRRVGITIKRAHGNSIVVGSAASFSKFPDASRLHARGNVDFADLIKRATAFVQFVDPLRAREAVRRCRLCRPLEKGNLTADRGSRKPHGGLPPRCICRICGASTRACGGAIGGDCGPVGKQARRRRCPVCPARQKVSHMLSLLTPEKRMFHDWSQAGHHP